MSVVHLRVATVPQDDITDIDVSVLDAPELARAARRSDPRPFLTAHVLIRALIAEHTGRSAASFAFDRHCATCGSTEHGKPTIVDLPDLHVSVSYGDHLAVAALSGSGPVGVDVEAITGTDFEAFDRVALAPDEVPAMGVLVGQDLLRARGRIWTRKEAVLKATGHGLSIDPRGVVVSSPSAPAALVDWRATIPRPQHISLADVAVDDDRAIAVAVCAPGTLDVRIG